MVSYLVRSPVHGDADRLGEIHVRAWQAAYGGFMPDDYLDSLSVPERADMWRDWLGQEPRLRSGRFVAIFDEAVEVEGSDELAGFILVGPAGGDADAEIGEVYALNVHPGSWGTGAGDALMVAGLALLADSGFRTAVLWVHPDNDNARGFYEYRDWILDAEERTQDVFGVVVPEVRYSRLVS